ncbi:MAG TPA: glutamyl-tRNA reductase [Gemmatimonadales bacterium]|nr:glutamyl-tRNA reductase [Gemmatimonadales bacterium]
MTGHKAMGIKVAGVNHNTAPLDVRERFAHGAHEVPGALARVMAAGASGGVLLSTCNRTEFYLVGDDDDPVLETVWALLGERLPANPAPGGAREYGYIARDREAVRHLYRVSAGLDSMILGESQIQGQVRDAWEMSRAQAGPVLHRLFQTALHVGSRVRTETGLGMGTASAASAGVAVAGKIFGDLAGRTALILGAGDVAELAATCLSDEGVRVTLVANRTHERARAIAERLGAKAISLDEAWPHFATVDIALCSTAAPHAVVTWERVGAVIGGGARRGKPLCILDLAVPRDVDPSIAQLENVFLYDVDDLQTVAAQATARRRDEIPGAERIVEEEADLFWAWYGGLGVVPTIKELRQRLDHVRAAELERALRRFGHLSPDDRAQLEQFSQALLNKFLHEPTIALKSAAEEGRGYGLLEAVRRLFGLEPPE